MFGEIAAWFVYALAIEILSQWLARTVSYVRAFIAGVLIIVLGFVLADFVGDAIDRTRSTTVTSYTRWFATGVRLFLYFVVITVGLDTMGVDTELLYIFATALAWGLAAVAIGWGGREYVRENVDQWVGQAKQRAPTSSDDDTTNTSSSD